MTTSLLQKLVLTPVLISATVFTILSIPLAIFGKQPVTIQLQEEPVFSGQLRDISTPYLGMAAVLSLGAGFATVALAGWRRSSHKSSLVEAQLLDITKNLQQKEMQLEALQLSDLQLKAFVDEPLPQQTLNTVPARLVTPNPDLMPPLFTQAGSLGLQKQSPPTRALEKGGIQTGFGMTPTVEPLIITTQAMPLPATIPPSSLSHANTQTVLNYTQAKPNLSVNLLPPGEIEELHAQLEQIMTSVQIALTATRTAMASETMPANTPPATPSWVVKDTAF